MDFPDIVNIYIYVCKFVLVVFLVWLCDKSAFMLIRVQFFVMFWGLMDFTSKGGDVCFSF